MARYNTVSTTGSVAGGNSISTPYSGLLTTLTGTGTVTVPNPIYYTGQTQTFYNSTGSIITLSTPSGNFYAPGFSTATTLNLAPNAMITIASDGTNYQTIGWLGGIVTATSLTSTGGINVSGGVVTLTSSTTGTINNVNIGGTTAGTGAFTTLTANSTFSLTNTTATHTISATTPSTNTGSGALVVSGGVGIAGAVYIGGNLSTGSNSITSGPITATGAYPQLSLNNPSSGTGSLIDYFDNGILRQQVGHLTTTTSFQISTGGTTSGGSGLTTAFTIDSQQRVGIGTTSPTYGLHVVSSIGNPSAFISSANGGGNIYLSCSNASSPVSGYMGPNAWNNNAFGIGSSSNHPLQFTVNGSQKAQIDTNGNFLPYADNTYNLGNSSYRWANVYSGDLHLSNEGSEGNFFDGSTGDWTIQEGETDLFIINNKSGKKYKFILQEL